jgi:hypothetical protein
MVLPRFAGIRPLAVLPCATPVDVAAALDRARRGRHPVAVRGGGHCFAGRSSTTGIVIDTSPMTGVRLDGRRAVVGAGTRLAEVYERLAAVDLLIRRIGAVPQTDDRHHGTLAATKRWLAADDTPDPRLAYLHSEYFRGTLPAASLIDRLTADRRSGEQRELDLTPWGGAYNRIPGDATAFPHRDAAFLLKQTATVAAGEQPSGWLDESYAISHPYGTGGAYPNFPEPALPADAYHLANTDRLRRIRAAYDPASTFGNGGT